MLPNLREYMDIHVILFLRNYIKLNLSLCSITTLSDFKPWNPLTLFQYYFQTPFPLCLSTSFYIPVCVRSHWKTPIISFWMSLLKTEKLTCKMIGVEGIPFLPLLLLIFLFFSCTLKEIDRVGYNLSITLLFSQTTEISILLPFFLVERNF